MAEKIKIIDDLFQQAIDEKIEFRDLLEQAFVEHRGKVGSYSAFWVGQTHDRFVYRYVNERSPRYQDIVECLTEQINDMKRILREKHANDLRLAALLETNVEGSVQGIHSGIRTMRTVNTENNENDWISRLIEIERIRHRTSIESRILGEVSMRALREINRTTRERLRWDRERREELDNQYERNLEAWENRRRSGFIYGQWEENVSELEVGWLGNAGDNGCGAISIFNAMYFLRQNSEEADSPCLPNIIHYIGNDGGFIAEGNWGTNPLSMVDYINRHTEFRARIDYLPVNLDRSISESDASILLYSASGGVVHYVTIVREGDQFLVYNEFSDDNDVRTFASIDDWMNNEYSERLNRGYSALALIPITAPPSTVLPDGPPEPADPTHEPPYFPNRPTPIPDFTPPSAPEDDQSSESPSWPDPMPRPFN